MATLREEFKDNNGNIKNINEKELALGKTMANGVIRKANDKKNNKRLKFRHRVYFGLFRFPAFIYCKIKYGVKIKKFEGDLKRNYFILYNHQTPADQFFLTWLIKKRLYFVATEDIFSNGFISRLLMHVFAPIPIDKTAIGFQTVKTCMGVAKEGGNVVLAPEGNRTYSGKTEYIKPSVVKLIRALKLPIMFVNITGGYGTQPRWSNNFRKGKVETFVKKVIPYEEIVKMTDDEIYSLVVSSLNVDDTVSGEIYNGDKKAEYLERVFYTCPFCGFTEWNSLADYAVCKKCGAKIEYGADLSVKGVDKDFPYKNTAEWFDAQNKYVSQANLSEYGKNAVYTDAVKLSLVKLYKSKKVLSNEVVLSLFFDKLTLSYEGKTEEILFSDATGVAILGRNKLNIKFSDKMYQIKGGSRFNAVKYMNFYYRFKNQTEDNTNGIFLGL